jgi:hypothetical protein
MPRKRNSDNDVVISSGGAAAQPRRIPTAPRTKRSAASVDTAAPARGMAIEIPAAPDGGGYEPSREEVARLAYLYWEARGCQGGSPEEDWLRAEQELRVLTLAAV